jgi:hypothetical protein
MLSLFREGGLSLLQPVEVLQPLNGLLRQPCWYPLPNAPQYLAVTGSTASSAATALQETRDDPP